MSTTTTPDRNSKRGRGIPRWVFVPLALFVWLVGVPLAHGILPWALSWLAPRFGWTAGYPGTWNWLGLIAIAAGSPVLTWDFASGRARARELPERIQRLTTPPFLMPTGPYAYTRNPMYVAELALWLGWTTFFGSLAILLGLVVLTVVIILVLRREERGLE